MRTKIKVQTLEDVKPLIHGHLADENEIPQSPWINEPDVIVPVVLTNHEMSLYLSLMKRPAANAVFAAWQKLARKMSLVTSSPTTVTTARSTILFRAISRL